MKPSLELTLVIRLNPSSVPKRVHHMLSFRRRQEDERVLIDGSFESGGGRRSVSVDFSISESSAHDAGETFGGESLNDSTSEDFGGHGSGDVLVWGGPVGGGWVGEGGEM